MGVGCGDMACAPAGRPPACRTTTTPVANSRKDEIIRCCVQGALLLIAAANHHVINEKVNCYFIMLPSGGNDGWSRNLAAYDRTCRQSTNQNTDENIVPGYPPIPQQAHVIHPSFATPSHMNSACMLSHNDSCHANYPASA